MTSEDSVAHGNHLIVNGSLRKYNFGIGISFEELFPEMDTWNIHKALL